VLVYACSFSVFVSVNLCVNLFKRARVFTFHAHFNTQRRHG
jgi:hypothetical protein